MRKLIGAKHYASEMSAAKAHAFAANEQYLPAADVATLDAPDSGINVHMFSYKGTVPSVHRRTINESAAIVADLNGRILR